MLNIEGFITKIRTIIEEEAKIKAYSPTLPVDLTNICAVTYLGGNPENNLCGLDTVNNEFRVLIRGTKNDTETRKIADKIFNTLHLRKGENYGSNTIIQIYAMATPLFIGKDEQLNNLYNIPFKAITK